EHAREVAHRAWIALWQREREGLLPDLQLPGLAVRQALFCAADELRAVRPVEDVSRRVDLIDGAAALDARVISRQRLPRIEAALEPLHPPSRQFFRLAYAGGGLDHADVARRAGLSIQRVRQILCEVRKTLRPLMEDEP